MTTLKNLKGTAIQFLDADPVVYAGAWSSGGALNTAREIAGGAGIQTSALAVGGNSPANAAFAITEEYNGSAWTEVADLNSGRNAVGSFGANAEAAIAFGGRYKISSQTSILVDYSQPITKFLKDNPHPGISIGVEFATSAHAFQLFATNYNGIVSQKNYMFNQNGVS